MNLRKLVRIGNQGEDGFLFSSSCILIVKNGRIWTATSAPFPKFTHFIAKSTEMKKDFIVTLYKISDEEIKKSGSVYVHLGRYLEFSINCVPEIKANEINIVEKPMKSSFWSKIKRKIFCN